MSNMIRRLPVGTARRWLGGATILVAGALFVMGIASCTPDAKSPLGIPNSLNPFMQKSATALVSKQLGESIGAGSPLVLDQASAYPLAQQQITDFHPTVLNLTESDLDRHLPPGDYTVSGISYCTQWSIHQPGQGVPYKIARIHGKQAPAIGALLARGTMQQIPARTLNVEAWRIQGGYPLSQWAPADKAIIHQLIPEFERALEGDYVAQVRNVYEKARTVDKLPPFEAMLTQLGAPGQSILQLQKARQVLANQTISNERLPEHLYQPTGDGLPLKLPADPHDPPSPWSEIRPGVFARFTCVQGNCGKNIIDLRVLPSAAHHARADRPGEGRIVFAHFAGDGAASEGGGEQGGSSSTIGSVFGILSGWMEKDETREQRAVREGQGYWDVIITYSQGKPAQALIFVPYISYTGIRG